MEIINFDELVDYVDGPDPDEYMDDPEPETEMCAADPDGCIWESDEVSPGTFVWFCDNPEHHGEDD